VLCRAQGAGCCFRVGGLMPKHIKRSMLPLNALRAFDAAARHLSFKAAAEDLSVTPAAISQQIRGLEDFLGIELFRRANRNIMLTDSAHLALGALRSGFEKLEEAVDQLIGAGTETAVRVSVSPSFASKWLVPRLARFYERRPDAVVKISATMALTDFRNEEVDLAIRYGEGSYSGLEAERLLGDTVRPMCAPEVRDGCTPVNRPEDLFKHTLIHDDSFSEDNSAPTWPMWLKAAGLDAPDGLPALHFNTHMLAIEAAVSGRGVVLARSSIADADLKAGRLVPVLDEESKPVEFAHYLVAPRENLTQPHVQEFVTWLRSEAAAA